MRAMHRVVGQTNQGQTYKFDFEEVQTLFLSSILGFYQERVNLGKIILSLS
jgi:hypothetical protein